MAQLTIDLSPDLERRLTEAAALHGRAVADHARAVLEAGVAPPGASQQRRQAQRSASTPASAATNAADTASSECSLLYAGLPRRTAADAAALAAAQGAPLHVRVEDLKGDF